MGSVLLVDDEPASLYALKEVMRSEGHEVLQASSGPQALTMLDGIEAVVTDLSMPGMDGLALLQAIRARDETLPVILLTAHGSERIAVRAIKAGAYDYVTKPFDIDELSTAVARAMEARALRIQNRRLSAERVIGRAIIGESAAMRRLLDTVGRIAPRDITVLVRGETGTGKELVASLLHAQSHRAARPLVRFNCAAIPAELADAELFGHARGAFTGAVQARRGYFAQADGGTLVLDEIGELPLPMQAKLLRVLQEGEIQPVGAGRIEKVDVRVVASTNRDLEAEARAGRFREDLYYRLAVVEIVVPPLRDHREDIPALVAEFARRYGERYGLPEVQVTPALLELLRVSEWPGNVRQLENTVARLVAMSHDGVLEPGQLTGGPAPSPPASDPAAGGPLPLKEYLETIERNLISGALRAADGNQSEAARRLGMGRSALIERLKKYGLS